MEQGGGPTFSEVWEAAHQSEPAVSSCSFLRELVAGKVYAVRRHIPVPAVPHPTLRRLCYYVALTVWLNHDEYILSTQNSILLLILVIGTRFCIVTRTCD